MSDEISQTVPRRGPAPREAQHTGAVVVVGSGASLDSLRSARLFPMTGLLLDIGRRAIFREDHPALTLSDPTVSSFHARIQRTASGTDLYVVEDLQSTNGTFVDGKRITGPTPLRDGALLFLGSQVLVFRLYTQAAIDAVAEDRKQPFTPVRTSSPTLALTVSKLRRLAQTRTEILLVGETGTGKEVFANAIHKHSGRSGNLVAINCAAIPRELVESELFGYEKGAHSTAQGRKVGLVELADRGTLFLDEIGDMPQELQAKLLRFLQDRRFTPLGSTRSVEADVRIVAATSRAGLDKSGHLQEAVLGRLGAQPITLPPLRDRIEDLGGLVAYFLRDMKDKRTFEPEAFHAMALHGWPLNVRELTKVMSEAEALSRGFPSIGLEHLPDAITATLQVDELEENFEDTMVDDEPPFSPEEMGTVVVGQPSGRVRRKAPSRRQVIELLEECKGSVAEVARRLNRRYEVMWRIVQRYGIDAAALRTPERADESREPPKH